MVVFNAFAYGASAPNAPFKKEEFVIDTDKLGSDYVVVEIQYSGFCHSDLHTWNGEWRLDSCFEGRTFVGGHEGAGHIVYAGNNVKQHKIGDRVCIGWQSDSCCECNFCRVGDDNLCAKSEATIINRRGTFASHCVVHKNFAFTVPDNYPLQLVGPLACGAATVTAPLLRYREKTKRCAIVGLGGLGHMAVQMSRALGFETTVLTRSHTKDEFAMSLGAHSVVDMTNDEEVNKYSQYFDLIINTSPYVLDWTRYLSVVRRNGSFVMIGLPGGEEGIKEFTVSLSQLIFNQISVSGSIVAGSRDLAETLRLAALHDVKPITEMRALSDINQTFKDLADGKARFRYVFDISK